jgi:hypothetical protein
MPPRRMNAQEELEDEGPSIELKKRRRGVVSSRSGASKKGA